MADNHPGDIMNNMSGNQTDNNNSQSTSQRAVSGQDTELLKSIDATLKEILHSGSGWSQSDARNMMPGRRYTDSRSSSFRDSSNNKWKVNRRGRKGVLDEFEDGMREVLLESIADSDFKDKLRANLDEFATIIGVETQDIPYELGRELSRNLVDTFKKSSIGSKAFESFEDLKAKSMSRAKDIFLQGVKQYDQRDPNGPPTNFAEQFQNIGRNASNRAANKVASRSASSVASEVATDRWMDQLSEAVFNINEAVITVSTSSSSSVQSGLNDLPESSTDLLRDIYHQSQDQKRESNRGSELADMAQSTVSSLGDEAIEHADDLAATLGGAAVSGQAASAGLRAAAAGLSKFIPHIAAATAAITLLTLGAAAVLSAFEPLAEGTKDLWNSMKSAFNRYQQSREKNLKLEQERLVADLETVVKAPFKILEDAAEEWYKVWDSQLRTIAGTQGYTKDDVYDLFGSYADRLRSEGLTSVISSADITTNLTKVLDSGLSGYVAEEFAYLATKLNAAIPTQDFFDYASTYASLAANAIKNGHSQSEAIAYANAELEQFASNVLYASRQLSGGFSTGLKDASSLFESSVKIVTSAKQGTVADVSGVLTSISAVVGSIAPDLSSSLVDAVVQAATGGNSSEIVALRSLAGVNASNTEFLRLLSRDPQAVFSALFTNLAELQNMSNDNFMEVAEGLSSVFGISMDAFARVDFNYLAQAISEMNVNNASLSENMALLVSGQTTTNDEQLKMAQINQYMLDEGLTYVLDNQAARAIQQHMWDEQIARELMEATYAVELQGSALEFLEGIRGTVQNIINFLNPFSYLQKGLVNLSATATEAALQRADVESLLEAGKVGQGNARDKYNLTTTNVDLNLTESIIDLLGGRSGYQSVSDFLSTYNRQTNFDIIGQFKHGISSALNSSLFGGSSDLRNSNYSWATVSKSTSELLSKLSTSEYKFDKPSNEGKVASTEASVQKSIANFQAFVDTMSSSVDNNKTYEDWKKTASTHKIDNFDDALKLYGRSEEELRSHYDQLSAIKASEYEHMREENEDKFWTEGVKFWTETHPAWELVMNEFQKQQIANQATQIKLHESTNLKLDDYLPTQIDLMKKSNKKLDEIYTKNKQFYKAWVDYYVNHTAYSKATLTAYDVAGIRNAEKKESGDAVLALAKALTKNSVDLKDPVVQTNVLLSQILIVAEAIMQQNNDAGTSVLPTTLAALGLGVIE